MNNWYESNYSQKNHKNICIIKSKDKIIGKIDRDNINFNKILREMTFLLSSWEMEYESK
jgi:hypothetical protein